MNVTDALVMVELEKKGWYSLGYCSAYHNHEYVKRINAHGKKRGALEASLNERTKEISFHADYKKQFTQEECDAMILLAFEFVDIVKENYKR